MSIPARGLPISSAEIETILPQSTGCAEIAKRWSDYVLDELLTLLKLRESHRVAAAAGEALLQQRVAQVERVTDRDFLQAWDVFRQYHDKAWSFTDCTSKVVIERLGIAQAFAFDRHFEEFGTVVRVP